ncbi:MAG TPA: hypothetical protein VF741_00575 [Candidatus Aquilonibacter sp.]
MPLESRIFVKTSVLALILTFAWGATMAFAEATGHPFAPVWAIGHAHLAFIGWLVNLVIGIALWMLPLNRDAFPLTQGRYPSWLPYVVYLCLNVGLVMRICSEPFVSSSQLAAFGLGTSAALQVLAIVLFGIVAWLRTRAPARPGPGVR